MKILLLAAGEGQRFTKAGYPPKPLITINNEPMWSLVLENFLTQIDFSLSCETIVATKNEYQINSSKHQIINLEGPQFGAAFSALQALEGIDGNDSLFILNVDQLISLNSKSFDVFNSVDGGLLHFKEPNKEFKWGRSIIYNNLVTAVVEKIPVSDNAHTGHYFFASLELFKKYATMLIDLNIKVNNEFFLSPIYNLMIADGLKIGACFVDEFTPIGIPSELEDYLAGYNG